MVLEILFGVIKVCSSKNMGHLVRTESSVKRFVCASKQKKNPALKYLLTGKVHHVARRMKCLQHHKSEAGQKEREFLPVRKPKGQVLVVIGEVRT